jgi:hypothetical protein
VIEATTLLPGVEASHRFVDIEFTALDRSQNSQTRVFWFRGRTARFVRLTR